MAWFGGRPLWAEIPWPWAVTGAILGAGLVFLLVRLRRAGADRRPPAPADADRHMTRLIERADCLLWEAQVEQRRADWHWHIHTHRSALADRLFGQRPPPAEVGLWHKFVAPEQQTDMDRRARGAMSEARGGYEQQFAVNIGERKLWLHESVSITPLGPDRFWLVGLVMDVTAQHLAEQASRASEERLQQLLAHANCMLWQAEVDLDDRGEFHWEWFVPKSELYRRMMGEDPDRKAIMPWGLMDVPEYQEIEQRSRHAMRHGLPGYEQEFRVIKDGRTLWMHEQVSIEHRGPNRWKLEGVVIDITAQRGAEAARRQSEENLRELLARADCLLWNGTVDLAEHSWKWEFRIQASALCQQLFGRPQPRPEDGLWRSFDIPERPAMDQACRTAMTERRPGYGQVFHIVKPDGTVTWIKESVTVEPLGGTRYSLVGVATDITAQRQAEEARRSSELRLRSLLARADCLLWEATMTLDDWKWNFEVQDSQLSKKLFGPPAPGYSAGLWRRFDIPERAEMDRRCRAAMAAKQPGYEQVFHIWRDDGSVVWIQENVTITELAPGRYSLVGVATDITRQHGAELALATEKERLAVTLRAMVEAVVTTDVSGQVLFLNFAAADLIQCDPGDAIGRPLAEVCRFENNRSGSPFEVPFARVAQGDVVVDLPPQTRLVSHDGRKRVVEGRCAPIHAPDSRVTGMVLVFRDVTEQDRLEQELVQATRLESVGVLAGGIAHDFNNILTGMMGNLALAQMEAGANVEIAERLREAEKATLRARDLTQQLLTFAKGGDPVRTTVNLDALLRETATFSLHGSSAKALFDIPADVWAANADKGQVGRVIQNLVINAVQAMPAGGMLRLAARNESVGLPRRTPALAPGDYVRIEIADTGEGIRPENLGRVFDPYFTTKQGGSGLGLAAVYSIVRKHGGAVDVASEVGRGTTFRLWLPASHAARLEPEKPAAVRPEKFYGRVLFMDDEEIIRKMATAMLGQLGFEVECTEEGKETVAKYREAHARGAPYTLVIMDLTVPGGFGGREAIGLLREIDPHVRAIVSSGYSSDPVLANYRAHGFCGVMAKPYQLEDILRAIREALAG